MRDTEATMSQRERSRLYSLSMAGMNLTVSAFLFVLARIDALAGGPGERVG